MKRLVTMTSKGLAPNVPAVADVRERVRREAPKTSEACVRTPYTPRISHRICGLAARKRRVTATVLLCAARRCSAILWLILSCSRV
jgi:hypothetical protein